MRKSELRISPIPAEEAILIASRPYKYIRHPMYASIIFGVFGLLNINFSWLRLGISCALLAVLFIKLSWEERMLDKKFHNYDEYKSHTKRLIPLIF